MSTLLNPYFGEFGGMYVPQILMPALRQLEEAFVSAQSDAEFQAQFTDLLKNYAGADGLDQMSEPHRRHPHYALSQA